MNSIEIEMYNTLVDLKTKYNVCGIKISFEDEGLTSFQAQVICNIAHKASVPVFLKVGGCEAKNNIRLGKYLCVDKIVAPMIESEYAYKKFIGAIKNVYDDIDDVKLSINIETISGLNNLEKILSCPESKYLHSIVMGRSDFIGSLNIDKSEVNSEVVYKYAENISKGCKENGKKLYVGGNVNDKAIPFFNKLRKINLSGLETRNIVFDVSVLDNPYLLEGINKALQFELLWLEDKKSMSEILIKDDSARIKNIKQRL